MKFLRQSATVVLLAGALCLPGIAAPLQVFEVTPDKEVVWKYVSPLRVVGGAPAATKDGNPRGANPVFRAYRYAPDYPGLAGKNLTPGKTVEEILKEEKDKESAK